MRRSFNISLLTALCIFLLFFAACKQKDGSTAASAEESIPEQNRFVVEVLDTYMYEPMEMVIFKDGRVLYVERRGNIKLYDPSVKQTRIIGCFDVSTTGNYEDGILGVTLDPDFDKNHWIYINYSPLGDAAKQNISRFEMQGDSIIMSSEKIVLEIPTQRETCCHSGGHLTFGPGRDLYISTGDNTSSKESDGFTPIDERPGRAPFDAQKSSGNTQDLRGKILRIHPEANGTYTVPDGNLFTKDGTQGKPEIYVMGTRNAFRFSVDSRNGYVYWGDVGPDGGMSSERGPESFDEFNQAKSPGNYGWPYFVADNKPYADFDFATNTVGAKFDPARPENLSPNNTGSKILPPARKAMIWYPYGDSKEFPELGKGSRSAMAGPVYYYDDHKNAKSRFPKYYDGKLFIYEWARSWVKVVSFDKNDSLKNIEPFLPEQEWYKPIDMKFGADGALYVLQYGANYFEHNPDSRLVKITYVEGNRDPVARATADVTAGAAPMTVMLSAKKSEDFDRNDQLSYSWTIPGGERIEEVGSETKVIFTKPGIYKPYVKVTDREGRSSVASVEIKVGNEMPKVDFDIKGGNQSFYFDNEKLPYKVLITDREDESVGNGIDPSGVFVSIDYLRDGRDLAILSQDAEMEGDIRFVKGKSLINKSDCKTCHQLNGTSIGPSYMAIADRYMNKNKNAQLADKIISGGNGNWGQNMMAAHPQHTTEEATGMVNYILSLKNKIKNHALEGNVRFDEHVKTKSSGTYILRAKYTDRGDPVVGKLTTSKMITWRSPKVEAEDFELHKNMISMRADGEDRTFVSNITDGSYMYLPGTDLTGIARIAFNARSKTGGTLIQIKVDSPDGDSLGEATIPEHTPEKESSEVISARVKPVSGRHDIYLVFKNSQSPKNIVILDWVRFENK